MLEEPFTGNLHRTIYTKESVHYSVSYLSEAVGWVFFIACSLAYLCSIILLTMGLNISCGFRLILFAIFVTSMLVALAHIVRKSRRPHAKMESGEE